MEDPIVEHKIPNWRDVLDSSAHIKGKGPKKRLRSLAFTTCDTEEQEETSDIDSSDADSLFSENGSVLSATSSYFWDSSDDENDITNEIGIDSISFSPLDEPQKYVDSPPSEDAKEISDIPSNPPQQPSDIIEKVYGFDDFPYPELSECCEDDTAIRIQPSRHVDYLSYGWREQDLWASWKLVTSKRMAYNNSSRLINASWRQWGKSKWKLRTVSPETLNWYVIALLGYVQY
jgi:hypothetical protein